MTPARHDAVFHHTPQHIAQHIADFVIAGLAADERVYVMATPQRWNDVTALLDATEPSHAHADGRLVWLDAHEILEQVAPGGRFDEDAATTAFARLLAGDGRARVYGEMVTLLLQNGRSDGAASLEVFGHELSQAHDTAILCGYDDSLFETPAHRARVADLHDRSVVTADDRAGAPAARPPLVLIADDVDDARELYGEYLRYSGFRVVTASDGVEAVRLARTYRPDVILLDVRMPRLTGSEAVRQLKTDPRFTGVPIIALTAHALQSERDALMGDGFDDVLAKPCLPDRLVLVIRQVLAI